MDDSAAAAEKKIAAERVKQELAEANAAFRTHFSPIQQRLFSTLQETYFKCANDCYGGSKSQEKIISNCIENCKIPLSNAKLAFEKEKEKYKDNMSRSLMICKDKYEEAKLKKKSGARNDMVSCAEQANQDSVRMLPIQANKLKTTFGIRHNYF